MVSDNLSCLPHDFLHALIRNVIIDAGPFFTGANVATPFKAGQVIGDVALGNTYMFDQLRDISFFLQKAFYDTEPGWISQPLKKLHQNLVRFCQCSWLCGLCVDERGAGDWIILRKSSIKISFSINALTYL